MTKRLYLTAIYFTVLLAVPGWMIYNYYDILWHGAPYKIKVEAYDPYDPFRGRYVDVRPTLAALRRPDKIARWVKDADGFVTAAYEITEQPSLLGPWPYDRLTRWKSDTDHATEDTVKNFKLERYYMNEKIAPLVEDIQRRAVTEGDVIHVTVMVKNGSYVIEGLYINGVAAEEYVQQQTKKRIP